MRKKNRTTIISTRPVAKLPTAEAPARAPEPNCELVTKSTAALRASSICWSLIEKGRVVIQSCSLLKPEVAESTSELAWFSTAQTISQATRPRMISTANRAISVASTEGTL
ncbi:hypothetical protein ASG05_05950 [Frigoribacterium sp. Leaf186]|nr:hypothetical protein ASG05_05950 [Frigoribacterium sp. Leaf186]